MKTLIAASAAFALAIAGSLLAQDRLERPVSNTSTAATLNVTFAVGTLGYVQDISIKTGLGANTATVYIVNYNLGVTNNVGVWVFTNSAQTRISSAWPVEKEDIVRCVLTQNAPATNNTLAVWFKNVIK